MVNKEYLITGAMLILVTYTLGLSLVSQAFPASQTTQTLSSTGTIQTSAGIGVYSNYQATTPLTSVQWGTLEPGQSQNVLLYIKNEGNSATTLSLETSNWSSTAAENYLDLSWSYNGNAINPDAVVYITLTLTVYSNIQDVTNFSFDIIIVGSV